MNFTKETFMKTFQRVYPKDVRINRISIVGISTAIVEGEFPDGTFFFVVEEGLKSSSVSSAFNSFEEAKARAV